MPKIGVFDSGIGGLSVAQAIQAASPQYEVVFVNDAQHVPYGDKQPAELLRFVLPILEELVSQGCDVIVIACNSVTTTIITEIRAALAVPVIGIEPMVKPAVAHTKTGIIAVCATPLTLSSPRYAWLKQTYASGITVLEPYCSQWASLIEHNKMDQASVRRQIDDLCQAGADVIVLGCTHYHWIADLIDTIANGRAKVIHPEQAIVRRVQILLNDVGSM